MIIASGQARCGQKSRLFQPGHQCLLKIHISSLSNFQIYQLHGYGEITLLIIKIVKLRSFKVELLHLSVHGSLP
jgi:hypothetical protein